MFWSDDAGFEHSRTQYFASQIDYASTKIGKRFRIAPEQKERMEEAGFENVVQKVCKVGDLGGRAPMSLSRCGIFFVDFLRRFL